MENGANVPKSPERREGNTRPPSSTRWCFTWNNYPDGSIGSIIGLLSPEDKYVIGYEIGESGTPHLQGFIKFKKKCRPMEKFRQLSNKIHWEKTKGNDEQNYNYCTKDGEYVQNIKVELKDPLKDKKLRWWQRDVILKCEEEPDDRTINWYWESSGNVGKTSLIKSLCIKRKDVLLVGGKSSDMKFGVSEFVKNNKLKILFIDLTRSLEDYVSYEGLESIKNGLFFSGKYESGMCVYDCPHVFVFANFEPDVSKMSLDRWNIVEIVPTMQTRIIDHLPNPE